MPAPDLFALEDAARLLDAHPDYRVLRRFQPRDEFLTEADGRLRAVVAVGEPAVAVVVDTETTGTRHESDAIIELTLLRFEYCRETGAVLRVTDVYTGLEDPGFPIPPESTAIHHITDDMVAGQRIDDARVAALLAGATHVIAHNAGFDRPFLEARLPVFETQAWACSHAQMDWAAEGFMGGKLEYLAVGCGFFYEGHRSEIDCRVLLEVLRRPLPRSGRIALGVLLANADVPALRLWATGSPFESKEALKGRNYRWDPDRRCWHRFVERDALGEECAWLKASVYAGRAAQVEVEVFEPRVRFSRRPGTRRPRVI